MIVFGDIRVAFEEPDGIEDQIIKIECPCFLEPSLIFPVYPSHHLRPMVAGIDSLVFLDIHHGVLDRSESGCHPSNRIDFVIDPKGFVDIFQNTF